MEVLIGMGFAVLIFVSGLTTGIFLRRRPPQPLLSPQPICGCTHHNALHDPETGECHGTVEEPSKWNSYGDPISFKVVSCTCRTYIGPVPVMDAWVPPALPPQSPF
jgi:hypothetical protein